MKNKIYIEKQEDRDAVIVALARNGYTVRAGRDKSENRSKRPYYIEYWREGEATA